MATELTSSINWVTFDTKDVQKAREILKDLGPDSTVDSIGLGLPFEEISNILFPATSTLHTRLRYQIFVPAIIYKMYLESIDRPIKNPLKRLHELELNLRNVLQKTEHEGGVIGRIAGEGLKYWPSQTYWGGINTMRIFGKESISRLEIIDDFMHKGRNLIENDDGQTEGDIHYAIAFNPNFQKIATGLFRNNSFRNDLTFELTKKEAEFLKGKLREVSIGPDTLSNIWINFPESQIKPIEKFLDITNTDNQKLDQLIYEAKNYSLISMGIMHAYRYALCDHRANKVFKSSPERRKEWNAYANNNLKNLNRWEKGNKSLINWNISSLKNYLLEYSQEDKIDPKLMKMVNKFLFLWKSAKNSDHLAKGFIQEAQKQEYYRRSNRSHFIDWQMTISENTKGEHYQEAMYDFRFTQGKSNALDIIKGLGRKN